MMKFISTLLFVIAFVAALSEGQSPGGAHGEPIVGSSPPKFALAGSQSEARGLGVAPDNGSNDESKGQGLPQGEAAGLGDDSEESDTEESDNNESDAQHGDFRLPKDEPSAPGNKLDEADEEDNGEEDDENELELEEIDIEGSGDDAANEIGDEASAASVGGLEEPEAEDGQVSDADDESEAQQHGDFRLPKEGQTAQGSESDKVVEEQNGAEEPAKGAESPKEESKVDNEASNVASEKSVGA